MKPELFEVIPPFSEFHSFKDTSPARKKDKEFPRIRKFKKTFIDNANTSKPVLYLIEYFYAEEKRDEEESPLEKKKRDEDIVSSPEHIKERSVILENEPPSPLFDEDNLKASEIDLIVGGEEAK